MQRTAIVFSIVVLSRMILLAQSSTSAPESATGNPSISSSVPLYIKFSATIRELDGSVKAGPQSVTFSLYSDGAEGGALWTESQTISLDARGHFSALLGAGSASGVPAPLFAPGDPRWIAITPEDGVERPRIFIATVPYAFKASYSDNLGGRAAVDFVTRDELRTLLGITVAEGSDPQLRSRMPLPRSRPAICARPIFEATSPEGPSFISDATSGPPFQINSNALIPNLNSDLLHGLSDSAFAKLTQINSFGQMQTFTGGVDLPASTSDSNAPSALDSSLLNFDSAAPDPQTNVLVNRRFSWGSQPVPGQSSPSARLALLFGYNGTAPSPTGLSINSDGTINFAPGQGLPTAAVIAALGNDGGGGGGAGTTPGTPGVNNPVVNTASYSWSQTEQASSAISAGPNEITLTPCPPGVNGSDLWHYLYISGSGTPEVVLISGGTCSSRAASGTVQFTAAYTHQVPYQIASATDGVQEAVNDAVMPGTSSQSSRNVVIAPSNHLFRARLSVRASDLTIQSSGASVTCAMKDTCIMLGDPASSLPFSGIVLQNLRVAPGIPNGTWPAVEDNAGQSTIANLAPAASAVSGASFGSLVQIDNDQAATVDGLMTNIAQWARCDSQFCSTAIVGPGPFSTNAGVLWVKNSQIALNCQGNGIDNSDSNSLNVSQTVIEGYAQFGVRSRTAYVTSNVQLSGVYEEVGACVNPLGTGQAGLIVENGSASVTSTAGPQGQLPQFANTGSTTYWYYIVVNSSQMGTSVPFLAGYANTNGTGTITVLWNQIGQAGTITYDILRVPGNGIMAAPAGTGLYAVATGVPAINNCSNAVCSFTDNASSTPTSYTAYTATAYWPSLKLWPGNVILTNGRDLMNTGGAEPTKYFTDQLGIGGNMVASAGAAEPSVFAQDCEGQRLWSAIWLQCGGGEAYSNDNHNVAATLMQLGSLDQPGGLKGRIILEMPNGSNVNPSHAITLMDSNPTMTAATPNNRPPWDDNDSYLGFDIIASTPSGVGISMGAPVSISEYIGNHGDGVHYLERLTAALKSFAVPVQMAEILTGTTTNTDAAGTITIQGSTSGGYPFTSHYSNPPHCELTPLGDPTATGAYWATITNAELTANVKVGGTISFDYHCWGTTVQQ